MRSWVTFFSQTGTEIANLCQALGRYPDAIVTNQQDITKVNKDLLNTTSFREHKLNQTIWHLLPAKPSVENYESVLSHFKTPVITLHGYLRIIPKEICEKYEIYNLHPGLITKYPELKGFNPQERTYTGKYKTAGCVIHRVTPGVDEGPILVTNEINIEDKNLTDIYSSLHNCAFNLWKSFIGDYNILK